MKTLKRTRKQLQSADRWDIDFHLPAIEIQKFPSQILGRVDSVASVTKDKRDPADSPEDTFQYIDIASVDVEIGAISTPQILEGSEAPSRARKVVRAFDIVISTCRPTRGAIAVVPPELHNQIASTGFSVIRPGPQTNPFFLHYALRLQSTQEQFRKWSTGSSYPAISDEDVAKTLIPVPDMAEQDRIARIVFEAQSKRGAEIKRANSIYALEIDRITSSLAGVQLNSVPDLQKTQRKVPTDLASIARLVSELEPLNTDDEKRRGRKRQAGLI
ncbi:restriction endonuclease subunit S [Stenotrophomonas sp.]|uniref:restriction endonuclease subunit S n=1 Tax=Stenotrophomonas sp. TaxID=69392 RepID=UPI0028AE5774|nr:restriction endonuclease subunit S [Stenotrophomonas sp.]